MGLPASCQGGHRVPAGGVTYLTDPRVGGVRPDLSRDKKRRDKSHNERRRQLHAKTPRKGTPRGRGAGSGRGAPWISGQV